MSTPWDNTLPLRQASIVRNVEGRSAIRFARTMCTQTAWLPGVFALALFASQVKTPRIRQRRPKTRLLATLARLAVQKKADQGALRFVPPRQRPLRRSQTMNAAK